jgi:hypothetical protein
MYKTYVAIACGSSLSHHDLNIVRKSREQGLIYGVCVANRAFEVAAWADYLVGVDHGFWKEYKESKRFRGGKFAPKGIKNTIRYVPDDYISGMNSGLYALCLLRDLGADRIILLGYDMRGEHFHGRHVRLKNPEYKDFERYKKQFASFSGCNVINCTRGSELKCFSFLDLERAIYG